MKSSIVDTRVWRWLLVLLALSLAAAGPVSAAVVTLTSPNRVVVVNSELVMDLVITYEAGEPGTLFSFGSRLDVAGSGSVGFQSLTVAAELDFHGPNGPGAFVDLSPGVLGAKGTIDISTPPTTPYPGVLLAQYRFQFPEEGLFTFTPREFNTLGPTEEIFVAGDGQVLDDSLTFAPMTIEVIPEPGTGLLGLAGVLLLLFPRRRRGGAR